MRRKELLSDTEMYRHTADIIENVKDTKISVNTNMSRKTAYVCTKGGKHKIMLGDMKGVERFTQLNHELGHVMFDSPIQSAKKMIKRWARDYDKEYEGVVSKIYWGALNTIEDQRVEALMSKLWLGNEMRFNKARANLGQNMEHWIKDTDDLDPMQVILAARFFRDELVKEDEAYPRAREILDKVVGAGQDGGLIGLKMYKKVLDRYIGEQIELAEEHKKRIQEAKDKIKQYTTNCELEDKPIDPDELDSLDKDWQDKCTESAEEEMEWEKLAEKLPDTSEEFEEENYSDISYALDDEEEEQPLKEEDLQHMMDQAQQDGREEINTMKEKLCDHSARNSRLGKDDISHDDTLRGTANCGYPSEEIANGLNKFFKILSEIPKRTISYTGDEVDIESYIRCKSRGYDMGECMADVKYVSGASVLISVDGSGSMENRKGSMRTARDLVATLYKSIENIQGVNLKVIVWSGNNSGQMLITTVNSLSETKKMTNSHEYYLTPTHLAIDYSADIVKHMKGRKKLLIIITDGIPQFISSDGYDVPQNTLEMLGRRSMTRALRKCPNIMSMLVTPSYSSEESCKKIFGSRLMTVDDMEDGKELIVKKFRTLVSQVLRA